jgi:hypothetical protein
MPWKWSPDVSNALLEITYSGDVARLYAGSRMLDDNFYNGVAWRVGLSQWRGVLQSPGLDLRILPGNQPIGDTGEGSEQARHAARLLQVQVTPEYQATVDF